MYGGSVRNDEKAMKSACNEVKGLVEFMLADTCHSAKLKKPLMALIHYRGFCVIAESIVRFSSLLLNLSISALFLLWLSFGVTFFGSHVIF